MTVVRAAAAAKYVDLRKAQQEIAILAGELNGITGIEIWRLVQFRMMA